MERVNQNRLRWTYDYCGLRTTTLFHDILILPCQQIKEDNLPPHWGSNPRTSVCEANALPLTPQQTATNITRIYTIILYLVYMLRVSNAFLKKQLFCWIPLDIEYRSNNYSYLKILKIFKTNENKIFEKIIGMRKKLHT